MKISSDIHEAALWLSKNKVVAIPTETVYGLAASIYSEQAIQTIYKIKNRPSNNPLIVHIKSVEELPKYAVDIPDKALVLAKTFWPGPLTLVLKKSIQIPDYITSNKDTVGIRVPDHQTTLKLLDAIDFPIAAPSANPSNCVSATSATHVFNYFGNKLPFVLDGGFCNKGLESTIVGFENDVAVIYRMGALSVEQIENVVGKVYIKNFEAQNPIAPGMFSKHYAPKTPLYVVQNMNLFLSETPHQNIAYLGFSTKENHEKIKAHFDLSKKASFDEAAQNLYKTLIEIDSYNFDAIVTHFVPNIDLGNSINDRLKRAAFSIT